MSLKKKKGFAVFILNDGKAHYNAGKLPRSPKLAIAVFPFQGQSVGGRASSARGPGSLRTPVRAAGAGAEAGAPRPEQSGRGVRGRAPRRGEPHPGRLPRRW